jgi:hypothetical protein
MRQRRVERLRIIFAETELTLRLFVLEGKTFLGHG